jgi:hypothetical protein
MIVGVVVAPDAEAIDPQGTDIRVDKTAMPLVISVGKVSEIRTLAEGERIEPRFRENNPKHRWILDNSPVKQGDLLRQDLLESYTYRVSRQPGRRMDVAMSPGESEGDVVLDPFNGSGTSMTFARSHRFRSIGIDLNRHYCEEAASALRKLAASPQLSLE